MHNCQKSTDGIAKEAQCLSMSVVDIEQNFDIMRLTLIIQIIEETMSIEKTLSIIKPDATAKNVIGEIYSRFEKNGLKIVAAKKMHLTEEQAGEFYAEHKERPFFKDLVAFMTSGPIMVQVLAGADAIKKNRDLMGATDPKKAEEGTIRRDFADSIDANAVHGSDSAESAEREIAFFFNDNEIVG